jgi:hypothetical protein
MEVNAEQQQRSPSLAEAEKALKVLLSEEKGGYLPLRRTFIQHFGLHAALILTDHLNLVSYLVSKKQLDSPTNWYYRTAQDMTASTGLSRYYQTKAIKALEQNRLLRVRMDKSPTGEVFKFFFLEYRAIWGALMGRRLYKTKGLQKAAPLETVLRGSTNRFKRGIKTVSNKYINKEPNSTYPSDMSSRPDEREASNLPSGSEAKNSMGQKVLQDAQRIKRRKPTLQNKASAPPIEAMPKPLQIWHSLSLVRKMTKQHVYDRSVKLLQNLYQGAFPATIFDLRKELTGDYKVSPSLLSKRWTEQEVCNILDRRLRLMVESKAFWPTDKEHSFLKGLSFEDFIYSAHNQDSWLLRLSQRIPTPIKERINNSGRGKRVDEGVGFCYSTTPW